MKITKEKLLFYVGDYDQNNNFRILQSSSVSYDRDIISDIKKISSYIKKNLIIIEQKINYTFKDLIIILDNFDLSFLNLTGFKKLNGTQISKENIFYIINSLKSCIDSLEKKKIILHIFNSQYILDKKKFENLPIGLFGDFYSHELSFNLIKENDYENLKEIFDECNLKIKKILSDSFVKGSLKSNYNSEINTFLYINIEQDYTKIFFIQNDALKYEQKFNFGTEIILRDISKVTSLNQEEVKRIINNDSNSKKINKKLIFDIAEARIKELSNKIYYKNINFVKFLLDAKHIYLEIADKNQLEFFKDIFIDCFSSNGKFKIKTFDKVEIRELIETAYKITHYGWKTEAIPITRSDKSMISRVFRAIFN